MTNHSRRDTQYVVLRNEKPKKATRYYYDTDDDDDSQMATITRRIVRTKPIKDQRIKYITTDELQSDHRRQRAVEQKDVCNFNQIRISFIFYMFVFFYNSSVKSKYVIQ
jgi:hypothetical protein